MKSLSLDALRETVEGLTRVYKTQLQVMEFSKDTPHILDQSIMKTSLEVFKNSRSVLPELISRCEDLKGEIQSPHHLREIASLRKELDQLMMMDAQVLFLMENLQEYTQDQVWSRDDLTIMEGIFEHLNEHSGLDMNPKEMIASMLSLKNREYPIEKEKDVSSSELEALNQAAYFKIRNLIQDLILEKVHPKQIQGALFTQYIHMMSLLVSSDPETYFNQQVSNAGPLILGLVQKLNLIEQTLEDNGSSEHMKEVAVKVTILREIVKERLREPVTQKEQKRHADRLAKAFYHLLDDIGGASASFLASTFLYNWVRLSTFESDVSEEYFQKLERHWDVVFETIYNDELLKAS